MVFCISFQLDIFLKYLLILGQSLIFSNKLLNSLQESLGIEDLSSSKLHRILQRKSHLWLGNTNSTLWQFFINFSRKKISSLPTKNINANIPCKGVGWLDHMSTLLLVFKETSILFPTVAILIYIPTQWKRWEYQTTWPASWEICMQVRKQQLELDMEQQTGSKLGKEYVKAVYCHPAF